MTCAAYLAEVAANPTKPQTTQPLEVDFSVTGLGKSEEECLFVLVPEQEQGIGIVG